MLAYSAAADQVVDLIVLLLAIAIRSIWINTKSKIVPCVCGVHGQVTNRQGLSVVQSLSGPHQIKGYGKMRLV